MVIHAAISEELAGMSGKYFSYGRAVSSSKMAEDEKLASQLWEKSSELLELEQHLPIEYIL